MRAAYGIDKGKGAYETLLERAASDLFADVLGRAFSDRWRGALIRRFEDGIAGRPLTVSYA